MRCSSVKRAGRARAILEVVFWLFGCNLVECRPIVERFPSGPSASVGRRDLEKATHLGCLWLESDDCSHCDCRSCVRSVDSCSWDNWGTSDNLWDRAIVFAIIVASSLCSYCTESKEVEGRNSRACRRRLGNLKIVCCGTAEESVA
jgi:hypothetical protein